MTASAARRPADVSGEIRPSLPFPDGSTRELTFATRTPGRIDLVLEGGGVKGLGLVGAVLALDDAHYEINRVAGASAGAIVAVLLAALRTVGRPVQDVTAILQTVEYPKFAPHGPVHDAMSAVRLLAREGLHDGNYLVEWLGGELEKIGVTTFADLRIDDDALPPERRYRAVVTVSDITRGKSIRLPWDYAQYGLDADEQELVHAVRASMSIPFFFEPVRTRAHAVTVAGVDYPAGTCTWVDGGMLDNFPVDVLGRPDGAPGRWPTVGVKLSAKQPPPIRATDGPISEALACLSALTGNADRFYVVPADAQRTIFVDHGDVQTTDFAITPAQQQMLLDNGRAAAETFIGNLPA